MKKEKSDKKHPKQGKVSHYILKHIVTETSGEGQEILLSTLGAQENDMRRYWASITPTERLANLRQLIRNAYGLTEEEFDHPPFDDTIIFGQSQ